MARHSGERRAALPEACGSWGPSEAKIKYYDSDEFYERIRLVFQNLCRLPAEEERRGNKVAYDKALAEGEARGSNNEPPRCMRPTKPRARRVDVPRRDAKEARKAKAESL